MELLIQRRPTVLLSISAHCLLPVAIALSAIACTDFEVLEPGRSGDDQPISVAKDLGVAIPDDTDIGIIDSVSIEADCSVDRLEIDIDIRHPWRGDVTVSITSPTGTLVFLKTYADEDGVDDVLGTFPTTIIPVQSLEAFEGESSTGDWSLKTSDLGTEDFGTWESWGFHLFCRPTN